MKNKSVSALIDKQYSEIKSECAIVAASDSKHAPYLVNAIYSLKVNFPDHPKIIIYNLGLNFLELRELMAIEDVEVRKMYNFVPHWRLNWSWKLFALTNNLPRYVLYLDLPNFVVMRSLASWFLSIKKNGYFLVSNGQYMNEITPAYYWNEYKLCKDDLKMESTFGAGIIGFDKNSVAFNAILKAYDGVVAGKNLGRSLKEKNRNYKPNLVRDCVCFRADQTILNLAFRSIYKMNFKIRKPRLYNGDEGKVSTKGQFLWYSRRKIESLLYLSGGTDLHLTSQMNRFYWWARIRTKAWLRFQLSKILRSTKII